MRLKNKLAVITAAASGMGRYGVEYFAREGATVAAIDVNEAGLQKLASDMKEKGHDIVTIVADLSKPEEARGSINEAAEKLGGIDILWAHAGVPGPGSVENLDLDAYEKSVSLNVTSVVLGSGEVVKHMRKRGGGSLIFTSSVSGLVGSMFSPIYSAAKFAVVGLGKSLAQSFAPDNIRVNVICPGLTDTPMMVGFVGRDATPEQLEENKKKLLASVPLGRLGRPEEMALAALWLASDESAFVTGVALPVDGGYTCR